ncbi:hypothetical protein CHS0354_015938, partial [Potamilus streckersoni]
MGMDSGRFVAVLGLLVYVRTGTTLGLTDDKFCNALWSAEYTSEYKILPGRPMNQRSCNYLASGRRHLGQDRDDVSTQQQLHHNLINAQ